MNKEGMKCVLYVRVSTEMQVDGFSLDGQRSMLKRYAEREGLIIKDIYEDAGKSGKSIEGRPAFKRMLADIAAGLSIDYILVYKLSRFGRNAADILNSIEYIQSFDINLIATEEGIDSSQTSGKLLISVLSAVSEIERENILEQTMNGRREKARQGGWNGGFAPYGYDLVNGELVINEQEAKTIRMMFEIYGNTAKGLNGTAKELNDLGEIKKIRQNGTLDLWTSGTVKRILDNPVYIGKIRYGKRTTEKVKGKRNEFIRVETDDYMLFDGKHEAIIDEDTWNMVQNKRDLTGKTSEPVLGREQIHLLSGILRCPECGGPMHSSRTHISKRPGSKEHYYYYICHASRYAVGRKCSNRRMIREDMFNYYVINAIPVLLKSKYFTEIMTDALTFKNNKAEIEEKLNKYNDALRDVNNAKSNLEHDIDNLPITHKMYEQMRKEYNKRLFALYDDICDLEDKIDKCKAEMKECTDEEISYENLKTLLLNYAKLFTIVDDKEKRMLLKFLIKEIKTYPTIDENHLVKSIQIYFRTNKEQQLESLIDDDPEKVVEALASPTSSNDVYVEIDFEKLGLNEELFEIAKKAYAIGYRDKSQSRGSYNTKKPSYKKIQAYIEETYGFKVHTAYIAEVKRAYGCDMYNAPNRVEKLRHPRKHPTKEKYDAIKESLIHFEIIDANTPVAEYVDNEMAKPIIEVEYGPSGKPLHYKRKLPTYKEIQDYVYNKYGYKVHSAYIAEVKRKHGIGMQTVRLKDTEKKYPCPPDRFAAIEDALRYFNMIE